MANVTLSERTYLTLDGKVTTNELEANELLGNAGDEVLEDRARELGLLASDASAGDASASAAEAGDGGDTAPSKDEAMAGLAKHLKSLKAADVRAMADEQGASTEGNADQVRERLMAKASDDFDAAEAAAAEGASDEDPDVDDSGQTDQA